MAQRIAFVVVACCFAATGAASTASPVTKVVELIKELQSKIQADGKAEQKIYDKYACWCETTSSRTANNIHQAMADIKSLSTTILELKGKVATRAAEIAELSSEMRDNQEAQDTATAIREKENGSYEGQKAEMEQTLNALERGIKVLMGAGTGGDESFLQAPKNQMELLRVGELVHTAMTRLPANHQLSPKAMSALMTFTRDPAAAEYLDEKAKKSSSFSPQSATIQGILKDMYDTFSMNLEKATETEATQQKNYEDLMAVKNKEMHTLTETRRVKEEDKAVAETDLATASQGLDDTTEAMNADTTLFDSTKKACTSKAAEWNERVRARTEELSGVTKALEILTSDENRALFSKAIKPGMETLFLQTDSEAQDPQRRAYNSLKAHATKAKSLRLAALAARVRTATKGHFDAVVEEIDKMMAVMKREEKDDQEERDWCKEETFKNEQEAARYEYKIEKLNTKLMKLNKRLEDLEASKEETIAQILSTNEDIAEMESNRIADHKAFQQAKSDDEQAVTVLGSAIDALGAFYKNNDVEMGKIQGGAKAAALVQEPVFEVDENQAPDATFSSAGKSGGESKGILSIMTMIKEDLEDEISNGVKTEKQTQKDFEAQLKSAKTLVEDLTLKKTNLESDIASTNDEINESTVSKEDNQGLLAEERDYLMSIKPDCDFMLNNFQSRRDARGQEVQGLIDAKGMLLGAAPPAMVQRASFDDADLQRQEFTAVSFLQRK